MRRRYTGNSTLNYTATISFHIFPINLFATIQSFDVM
jgi:hypothetical protein